jgi:glycosyltransferase involved in cell wall biosynthesis
MCPSQKKVSILTGSISHAGGGIFDSVRNLAIAIKKENRYLPTVAGLRDSETDRDRPLWEDLKTEAFDIRGPRGFGYAPELERTLELNNPDILHVHALWMYSSVAAIRWSDRTKPYIVSPHGQLDSWALNNSRLKKRICAALYERRHLRGAACIHVLNQAEAAAIRSYGLSNPICVIPNGVELPADTEAGPTQERRTLLYLGRLHPQKGLPKLIEAWSLACMGVGASDWRLVIAGWDQIGHRGSLETLAARFNVSASISFVGPQFGTTKAARFTEASAFVLPSLSEGMPISVLEAWSWRLPVLMTPQCNLAEGAAAGAAIMMEPEVQSISTALRRLFSMSARERETMGMNGRRLVEQRFQWPQIAKQMADVYDWMLGGSRPSTVEICE